MVRFRALKFVLLSLRQLTKPCVQSIISRASHERPLTRHVCTSLGRFSLALSAVTAEWGRREEVNRMHSLEDEENDNLRNKAKSSSSSSSSSATNIEERSANMKSNIESGVCINDDVLQFMRDALGNNYNKQIDAIVRDAQLQQGKIGINGNVDASAFTPTEKESTLTETKVDVNIDNERKRDQEQRENVQDNTEAQKMKLNYNGNSANEQRQRSSTHKSTPKRFSSWYVFRQTYHAPFPSPILLSAGADLLIELLVYGICIFLLFIEVRQETLIATRREINARIAHGQLADKINEIITVVKNSNNEIIHTNTDCSNNASTREYSNNKMNVDTGSVAVTCDTLQPIIMEEYQMDKRIERHSLLRSLTFLFF